jgi:hypothetical protein
MGSLILYHLTVAIFGQKNDPNHALDACDADVVVVLPRALVAELSLNASSFGEVFGAVVTGVPVARLGRHSSE